MPSVRLLLWTTSSRDERVDGLDHHRVPLSNNKKIPPKKEKAKKRERSFAILAGLGLLNPVVRSWAWLELWPTVPAGGDGEYGHQPKTTSNVLWPSLAPLASLKKTDCHHAQSPRQVGT